MFCTRLANGGLFPTIVPFVISPRFECLNKLTHTVLFYIHSVSSSYTVWTSFVLRSTLCMLHKNTQTQVRNHFSPQHRPPTQLVVWQRRTSGLPTTPQRATPQHQVYNGSRRRRQDPVLLYDVGITRNHHLITSINSWHTRRIREAIEIFKQDTVIHRTSRAILATPTTDRRIFYIHNPPQTEGS